MIAAQSFDLELEPLQHQSNRTFLVSTKIVHASQVVEQPPLQQLVATESTQHGIGSRCPLLGVLKVALLIAHYEHQVCRSLSTNLVVPRRIGCPIRFDHGLLRGSDLVCSAVNL